MNFDFKKYACILEDTHLTVSKLIGPLMEDDEVYEECGDDCDCEPCKEKQEADKEKEEQTEGKKWIQAMHMKKGALRKKLGYGDSGKNISAEKLNKATHSKNPKTRKQAALAKTLKKLHK